MITQKHEEGDHGDTSNEADTHIVPEKEAETIEENPTPSYDANFPGREVCANQVKTEKQDGKYHSKTRRLTRKNMMPRKAQTTQMRMEQKLNKRVQRKNKNITCCKKQKENKKGTTLDRTYLLASKQARQYKLNCYLVILWLGVIYIKFKIIAGTMEKGDKDSDSVNKAIEDLYNVVCKPWTQREM